MGLTEYMKTSLITALILACGAMADDCVVPRMSVEKFPGQLDITWEAQEPCFWWYVEQSTNLVHWRTFPGAPNYDCPAHTNRCFWYIVAPTTNQPTTFYRLRRAPGL